MAVGLKEYLWHRWLNRPYRLAVAVNKGAGTPVVLLHGLASSHDNWQYVLPHLSLHCRIIVPELLGFGDSPKPEWREYALRDHAREVLATLKRLNVQGPILLAGHSMGALIAVEIAKQRPDLVGRLVLCGMPLYLNSKEERRLVRRDDMYFKIYTLFLKRPEFTLRTAALIMKHLPRIRGFSLTKDTWLPFEKSTQNAIMHQTTYQDIRKLTIPINLLCGRLDIFVMRNNLELIAKAMPNVTLRLVNEPHEITPSYGKAIAQTINQGLRAKPFK